MSCWADSVVVTSAGSVTDLRAKVGDGGFEEGEDLGDQIAVGDGVVHPDSHRHHLAAVLFTELSPVDDRLIV